jgi:protein-tyrosine kinase
MAARVGLLSRKGQRRLCFTSSWEGEGKTSLVAGLGVALAQTGFQVLLIDTDLRRPTLSRLFGTQDTPGLIDALKDELVQPEQATPVDRLRLIAAGRLRETTDYGALLSRPRLGQLLQDPSRILICDTPPLSVCHDALIVAAHLDGVYLVSSATKFVGVPEGHFSEDIRDQGIPLLGVVMTSSRGDQKSS